MTRWKIRKVAHAWIVSFRGEVCFITSTHAEAIHWATDRCAVLSPSEGGTTLTILFGARPPRRDRRPIID